MGKVVGKERAMLRLEAWRAVEGWGTTLPLKEGETFPDRKPWDWETRMVKAEELFKWMVKRG